MNCLKSLFNLSNPITSAIHGISMSSICFLKSLSGSLTIKQILVSNFELWNGFGIVTYKGLGVGFSGTLVRVNAKWINESSSARSCFFSAFDASDCFDLKNFWSAFTAVTTYLASRFCLTSDSILEILFWRILAFSFFNYTKSDSNLSLSSMILASSGSSVEFFLLVFLPIVLVNQK